MKKIEILILCLTVASVALYLFIGPYQEYPFDVFAAIIYLIPPIVAVLSIGYLLRRPLADDWRPLIFALFIGLLLWLAGEICWNIYRFLLGIEIPYPSVADLLWITGYIPFGYFLVHLYRKSKDILGIKERVVSTVIAVIMAFIVGVVLFGPVLAAFSGDLVTTLFDFAYPISDVFLTFYSVAILLALLKVRRGFGWIIWVIPIILFVVADLLFSYLTSQGMYYNGHPLDTLYIIAYFMFAFFGCRPGTLHYMLSVKPRR